MREHYITAFLGGLTISLFPTWLVSVLVRKYPTWASEDLGIVSHFLENSIWQLQVLFVLAIVVIMPVLEEILFRGAIWSLIEWMGKWVVRPETAKNIAFIAVSLLFVALHGNVLHAMGLLPLSLFVGWLRLKTGELGPSVLAHATNNAMACFLMMV
jgi:membrane protease YdiL (CAAX protease family)